MQNFQKLLQAQFNKMCATGKLFRSSVTGQKVWELYLGGFTPDQNPVFRDPVSTTHNCNLCNNFMRRYGNVVALDDNYNIMTMFDIDDCGDYSTVALIISEYLKTAPISDVFFETFHELNSLPYESCKKSNDVFRLGVDRNVKRYTKEEAEKFGVVKPNEIRDFRHMYLDLPKEFVDMSGKSVEALMGEYRDAKNVFQRAMEEIPIDTLNLVKDLINQGSLLNGDAYLSKIERFIPFKLAYNALSADKRDNWCWVTSYKLGIAKFRNEVIGTLCVDLAEGKELNDACKAWNQKVDPINYMKATAPITKKQIEEAQKFVEQNGYEESFDRRLATLDDIKVTEIKHINAGDGTIKKISVFDSVKVTSTRHKRSEFDGVEEIHIDKFMADILPTCTAVEAFLRNVHDKHMVSLTTANNKESKPIFKWTNNYSWTFNGNLAGKSEIKEAVKNAGGNVEGILNFRLAWNYGDGTDNSDLDAWAEEPNGTCIGFNTGYRKDQDGNKRTAMSGQLDVDNTGPGKKMGVENITWTKKSAMKDGVYKVWVNQYSARNSQGFKVEIDIEGEEYAYEYNQPVRGSIPVAKITLKNGVFTIKHILPESAASAKEIYGLTTNEFHKVNLVCLSPNHWDDNKVGNKHYFFMLEGCKSPVGIRGFHNENLTADLLAHRKVMEVLGMKCMIPSTDKQLSGLGFNATVRDELILRLSGSHKRVVKIKF
jgi:hypothetical protein